MSVAGPRPGFPSPGSPPPVERAILGSAARPCPFPRRAKGAIRRPARTYNVSNQSDAPEKRIRKYTDSSRARSLPGMAELNATPSQRIRPNELGPTNLAQRTWPNELGTVARKDRYESCCNASNDGQPLDRGPAGARLLGRRRSAVVALPGRARRAGGAI